VKGTTPVHARAISSPPWFRKITADPAVERRFPQGWRDMEYIVSSNTVRRAEPQLPWLGAAFRDSTRIASWGDGPLRVDVLRVNHPVPGPG
jgi:hypothetical protein